MTHNEQSLIAKLHGYTNLQSKSPLFTCLPAEIRNHVFCLALLSYDDLTRPYPLTAHYRRPGYCYHQIISTALLQTCRRIYCETHDLPLAQNEHVFWCTHHPGPPVGRASRAAATQNTQAASALRVGRFFRQLTPEQRRAVGTVHVFATVDWLETQLPAMCRAPEVQARRIRVTIRHADWRWAPGARRDGLDVAPRCGRELGRVRRLERLEIDVETLARYEDKVRPCIFFVMCVGGVLTGSSCGRPRRR